MVNTKRTEHFLDSNTIISIPSKIFLDSKRILSYFFSFQEPFPLRKGSTTILFTAKKDIGCKETGSRVSSIANRENIRNIYANTTEENFDGNMLLVENNLDGFCVQL